MRRLRWIETVAWFAFYALVVSFLFGWNSAPQMFGAVFITRTAADWLPGATRAYEPGTTISGSPSPYFAGGWWRAEAEFRWGRGTRSELVIEPTSDIPAGSRIVTHLGIFPLRTTREYRVDIIVNDERLGQVVATSEKQLHEVALPFALPAGTPASILIESEFSKSPLSQGYGLDQRELGLQFFDLTVLPPQ